MNAKLCAALLTAFLIITTGGHAGPQKGKGKGPEKETACSHGKDGNRVAINVSFTKADRDLITGWFHSNPAGLPPGLAKQEQLPPGLQKQLVKNGTLPPGLQKKVEPLPVALERQLPPLPAGYERLMIGGSVIIMNGKTRLIADVFYDAFH
jgi:hypothetical protein